MHIEDLIRANTEALIENTKELKALRERLALNAANALAAPAAEDKKPAADKPKAETKPEPTEPEAPAITKEMLTEACLALIEKDGKNPARAKAILGAFGVAKVPLLKPEDYPAAFASFKSALGESDEESLT